MIDIFITQFDRFLRTVAAPSPPATRRVNAQNSGDLSSKMAPSTPQVYRRTDIESAQTHGQARLTEHEKRHAAGLMRVNHAGEVAAQALYAGQSLFARTPEMQALLHAAAREEQDHLAWTDERLRELGARPSVFNPFWYVGAYALGAASAALGDKASLGFLKATENQVEAHLTQHLDRLPSADTRSREIVAAMREDEAKHAKTALEHGGAELPKPIQLAMAASAKVMTTTAYYI